MNAGNCTRYRVTFTDLGKAAAEKSSSLAAVEAKARAEIHDHVTLDRRACLSGNGHAKLGLPRVRNAGRPGVHCFVLR